LLVAAVLQPNLQTYVSLVLLDCVQWA